MRPFALSIFASVLALSLAACSDEKTDGAAVPPTADPPAAAESSPPATPDGGDDAAERDRAVNQLRDGAKSIAEGAGTLLKQGRDAAEQAIEDAGPAIDKAGDYARELGRIAKGAAEQAAAELRNAAEDLNRRIEESKTDAELPEGDPQARLAAPELLRVDTLSAARRLIGPQIWTYGVPGNEKVLEAFVDIHHRQGLSPRRLSVEELFHPATFEAYSL